MRVRWLLGTVSGGVMAWAACVGNSPSDSTDPVDGGSSGNASSSSSGASTSSGGGASSGGSSSGAASSSGGALDASGCPGVFCEDFEGDPAFAGWTANALDGRVLVLDGHVSTQAAGVKLDPADSDGDAFWKAYLQRDVEIPAARYARLDAWFLAGQCDHNLFELINFYVTSQPIQLRRGGGLLTMRYFTTGADGGAQEQLLEFVDLQDNAWTPVWAEIDRVTGAVYAGIGTQQVLGTKPIILDPGTEGAHLIALRLGAAARSQGCEVRFDDVAISVRD